MNSSQRASLADLFNSHSCVGNDIHFSFPNMGEVEITSITRANLSLLRRARTKGCPGLIVSCPDFEREAIAIVLLAALENLMTGEPRQGLHKVQVGDKVAIGNCVVKITSIDEKTVRFSSQDESLGLSREVREFPLAHNASAAAELSLTRSTKKRKRNSLRREEELYQSLAPTLRDILNQCGRTVQPVGYVTSPSQYANDAPTAICKGKVRIGGREYDLNEAMPVAYVDQNGEEHCGFKWPFACTPSIYIGPRVDGVGSISQIIDISMDESLPVEFVSLNISTPDLMNTTLLSDILDLKDCGIEAIGFCDRWTMDRLRQLGDQGFLLFDWDDCNAALLSNDPVLSDIQRRVLDKPHEIVYPVPDERAGLTRAAEIVYNTLGSIDVDDDDVLGAIQDIYVVLGSAIRMTEAPDKKYSDLQCDIINSARELIEDSRVLMLPDYNLFVEACGILTAVFRAGHRMPKEQVIFDLIVDGIEDDLSTILVVDRNRVDEVYAYWAKELELNEYSVKQFKVIAVRDYLRGKYLGSQDRVIFSGWYDKGTMVKALHAGLANNVYLVLYGYEDGNGGLEVGWRTNARLQWNEMTNRCLEVSDKTLDALDISPLKRVNRVLSPKRVRIPVKTEDACDEQPSSFVSKLEEKRINKDIAKDGEESVLATPVLFHDGTHVWLRAKTSARKGGRLLVISNCLAGKSAEPEQKSASALLPGDVVLRTHSDKLYIKRESERSTENYDNVLAAAHKWREPIKDARMAGYTDAEIVDKIYSEVSETRTKSAVRAWVRGRNIAPQAKEDMRAIFVALGFSITDEELNSIEQAVSAIRNKHRAVGRIAAKDMVAAFIRDLAKYGLDSAVAGFDERHEAGDIELLRVACVGDQKDVAINRVDVL